MPALEKTLNVRLPASTWESLNQLTQATGRSKSWLAIQALDTYISQQEWQIAEVMAGIAEAEKGDFATAAELGALFSKYES